MSTKPPRQQPSSETTAAYPWRGFERPPEGCLFEQFIDVRGAMGVAYERSLRFEKEMHVHDRLLLVFPRGGTSMRVRTVAQASRSALESFVVTSEDGLAVPALLLHDDHWVTDVYDTLALLPSDALMLRMARQLGMNAWQGLSRAIPFRRSAWLSALLGEYFQERVLRPGGRQGALEELLAIEFLRAVAEPENSTESSSRPGPSSLVARALRHLEGNLFAEIDLEVLCRVSGASRSSLLRHFRSELGTTPKAYLAARRLDEGKRLLEGGRYGIAEVAGLVGYQNPGAFGEAFRRRFGRAPSAASVTETPKAEPSRPPRATKPPARRRMP